jgi:hypothetical protein
MRSPTRATLLATSFAALGSGCGGGGDSIKAVDTAALATVLVTEADDVDLSSFGPVPMTSAMSGDDSYYIEPPAELCAGKPAPELVATDHLYGYMGDGGDYRYADQWVSGETVESATSRFASGLAALEACVEAGDLRRIDVPPGEVDDLVRYIEEAESPTPDDEYRMIIYARNGGVVMLHTLGVARHDKYSVEQRDHLAAVVVEKLAELGRVEVPLDSTSIAATSVTTPPSSASSRTNLTAAPSTERTEVATTEPETSPPSTLPFPSPPIDESFRFLIPRVEGYDDDKPVDVVWPFFDLPGGASAYAVEITATGSGEQIATLIVAGRTDQNQLFETYVGALFDAPVPVTLEGLTPIDDQLAFTSNNALPRWESIADAAVVSAELPDLDAGRWTWRHDELIWIVTGNLAAESYVSGLIGAQGAGSDPFNYQGLDGGSLDLVPDIPAVQYWDLPRTNVLQVLGASSWGPCTQAAYNGYVAAVDDTDPEIGDERSLFIYAAKIGNGCQDNGFYDSFLAELDTILGLEPAEIAGRSVRRSDREIYYVTPEAVVHLSSQRPETLTEQALVIEAFIRGQP